MATKVDGAGTTLSTFALYRMVLDTRDGGLETLDHVLRATGKAGGCLPLDATYSAAFAQARFISSSLLFSSQELSDTQVYAP